MRRGTSGLLACLALLVVLAGCAAGRSSSAAAKRATTPAAMPATPAFYVLDSVRDASALRGLRGDVVALAPSDGTLLWRHQSGNDVGFQPEALDGVVYDVSDHNTTLSFTQPAFLEALAPASGAVLWRHETDRVVIAPLAAANGVVYLTYGAGKPTGLGPTFWASSFVEAVSARDGSRRWRTTVSGTPSLFAIADGTLYFAYAQPDALGGSLTALDAGTGKTRWTTPIGVPRDGQSGMFAPIVVNGIVYLDTVFRSSPTVYFFTVNAFSAADGHLLWQYPLTEGESPPLVTGGLVLFTWFDDSTNYASYPNAPYKPAGVIALDAATGSVHWRYELPGVPGGPLILGGTAYVSVTNTSDPKQSGITALRARDGKLLWHVRAGQPAAVELFTGPIASGGLLATLSSHDPNSKSETLSVLRAQDGGHVWSQQINGTLVSPALVAQGGNFYVRVTGFMGTANLEYLLLAFRASDGTLLWQHSLDE